MVYVRAVRFTSRVKAQIQSGTRNNRSEGCAVASSTANAYRTLAASRSLLFLSMGRALRSFNQAYLGVITPLYLIARGAGTAEVGLLVTVWAAGSAILGLAAGFFGDRFGRKAVLAVFSLLGVIAAFAFFLGMPFWVLGVAGALGGIGRGGGPASGGAFGPFYSAEQALVAEHVEQHLRTRIFAAFSMVGAIGGALGFLLTFVRDYRIDFLLAAIISAILLFTIIPIRETHELGDRPLRTAMPRLSKQTRAIVLRFVITNATNGLAVGFLGPMLVLWFHLRYHAGASQIGLIYLIIATSSIASYRLSRPDDRCNRRRGAHGRELAHRILRASGRASAHADGLDCRRNLSDSHAGEQHDRTGAPVLRDGHRFSAGTLTCRKHIERSLAIRRHAGPLDCRHHAALHLDRS